MAERRKSTSPMKYPSNLSDSNVQSTQRFSFTSEDVYNYLYGYLPIQLVDPAQFQRERQTQQGDDESTAVPWCDICSEKHEGECPMHGPLHSLRKLVSAGQSNSPLENGSVLKFPDEVCLCTSSIPCMGCGVCARKRIPAGTWIGPYEGKLMRPEDIRTKTDTEYMWEVFHDGQVSHYLDGKDEVNSSWMRFVHCARHKKEQNMVVFQYHGCVYYRTIRDILPGQELLVWYDSRYSQFMGVPMALNDSGSRGVQPPRDLVAQDRARVREKSESGESPAKRLQPEHESPVYTHSPPQRGRPPLRRGENEHQRKPEVDNSVKFVEEQRPKHTPPTRRPLSYRGRGRGRGSHYSSHRVIDPADDFTWRCNQCFKAFANREQLEVHHCNGLSNGKNYNCPHCNQTFSHPVEFRAHVESHVNERPFRCGYCASAFTSATLLNQHVRVHMAEGNLGKPMARQDRIAQAQTQEFSF